MRDRLRPGYGRRGRHQAAVNKNHKRIVVMEEGWLNAVIQRASSFSPREGEWVDLLRDGIRKDSHVDS